MVRRRHSFLLLVSLVSFGVLYVTVTRRKEAFNSLYPQLILADLNVSALDAVFLKVSAADAVGQECQNGSLVYGSYCVISPYNDEVKIASDQGLVTLCTQGTVEFLQHVAVLCNRWSSPISVAVYSPLDDYEDARIFVQLLRQCDSCTRYWVNWHFFLSEGEALPPFHDRQPTGNCSQITQTTRPRKRRSQGIYPINVGRNIARYEARTPFVFSIDIELYPSFYIPAMFERMLRSQEPSTDNQVWVFPVFEVLSEYRAPFLKSELRTMYTKRQAISFHRYRCDTCHKIPNLTQWMEQGAGPTSEVEDSLEPLRVWSTVKRNRQHKLHDWEPFFIGTTKDPEFDIRLSWEGKQNKMQMVYEMCMKNYNFHIVENAFLVHTPGINVYNASKERGRMKHLSYNQKVITSARTELILKYGSINDC